MRVIKEIVHSAYRITIFEWNQKYILKLEQDNLEQTYKVDQYDITSEGDIEKIFTDSFLAAAVQRFREMSTSLDTAMANL